MKNILKSLQHGITASVLAVALFVTGAAALAATDTGGQPAPSTSPSTGETTTVTTLADGSQLVVPVTDAGVVTVARDASALSLVHAIAEPGWQAVVEVGAGRELEVSFRSTSTRHDVNIELEDGQVRIRIRTRAAESSSPSSSTTVPASTTPGSSTTTVPDSSTTVPTSTTLPNTSTTAPTTTLPTSSAASRTVVVLDAGTADFVVEGGQLKIVATTTNPGWGVTVERSVGREVEASWRGPDRVDLNLELEDGMVRVRIRDRRTDVRTEERLPVGDAGNPTSSTTLPTSTTVPTSTTAPSTTVPDRTEVASSTGGTVTVTVSGNDVTLVSAVPAPGYHSDIRSSGGDRVEVRFESGNRESRIELEMSHGTLQREIEDR